MLIITDQILNNFERDSCFELERYPNITLNEYLKLQSEFSKQKKQIIVNNNIVV